MSFVFGAMVGAATGAVIALLVWSMGEEAFLKGCATANSVFECEWVAMPVVGAPRP